MNRRILVVDDDAAIRETFERHLVRSGFEVVTAPSAERAFSLLSDVDPGVVVTDVRMPGMGGIGLVERIRAVTTDLNVVVITAFEDMRTAVAAMRAGAFDYLVKPLDLDQIELVLERALRDRALRQRVRQITDDAGEGFALDQLVGRDPRMIEIYKRIGALALNRASVLVRGETGTGKEVIARAVHFNSPAAAEPFVAVNCTAVPEPLLESELFGHVRGAFTGAIGERRGRFEQAGRGTIFLDEIGDISAGFQAKLLRVLQQGEFYPVGGERPRNSEARVIAATHRDLEAMVRSGAFREDLYYRLRVVELRVPPLRDRRDDIPLLVEHLLGKIRRELHRDALALAPASLRRLQEYAWPGNVRELENVLVRAAALSPSGVVGAEDLVLDGLTPPRAEAGAGDDTLAAAERRHLVAILRQTGGNKRAAARILDIPRPRLDRLLARHAILATECGRSGNEM